MFISNKKLKSSVFINENVNKNEIETEVKEIEREVSELDRLLDEFNKRKRVVIKGNYYGKKVGIKKTGSKVVSGWNSEKIRLIVDKEGVVIGRQVVKGKLSKMEEINRDINRLYVEKWLEK